MGSDLPDGKRNFLVESVEKRYGKNNGEFFIWKLTYDGGSGDVLILPNMMGGLLKILECTEIEPGKFDWSTEDQHGKMFNATVSHKPDAKDPSKIRTHIGEFSAIEEETPPGF
jgi:hypothetical protein